MKKILLFIFSALMKTTLSAQGFPPKDAPFNICIK